MKRYFLLIVLALFTVHTSEAQSSCSAYYPLVDGANFQYTNYNKKGKEEGQINYKVTNVQNGGDTVSAIMMMEMVDRKGNTYTSDYEIACDGNVVKIDFKSLMNEQMMSQFEDMEMDISGTDVELPNNLSVGQELPDGNMELKMKMGGAINMNMNVETINRKVEKKESVTTPAGTFDCFVIYSETKTKMMMGNQTFPSRTWLAEGVGMVKQESYNNKGKLTGSMVLTQFSK
ncbi:hypothetical protein Murru_0769 [Allomuricauda ruestringensis DSM 13258]|uniref:DUF3108 domain-containing protein n=1 Tax=Allomuricauda ruestringensis (strain DSM 13258 / CIP 107369 / LMG 19739 / B1) TaxID=886377 RepID=G2PJR0_ALLRU|nr:hypothetical protein [Allomuricauda ruestringensis]AEM69818.1 hypothetical protein Murru_0769 [Allomuricauda ruestringensis DSM 13258]